MKESAIVIFLPESEISEECQITLAKAISNDTGYEMEHITLHQVSAHEVVSSIAGIAKVMHHVKVGESPEAQINPEIRDAIAYILNKYNNSGKIEDIEKFRVRFIIDAQNAFNSNRKSADLTNFKNYIQLISTHRGDCASVVRRLYPNSGITREHIEAILSVHNYYTKKYV